MNYVVLSNKGLRLKAQRLDKLLANLGYGVRKDVRGWIRQGLVTVDGKEAFAPSQKVFPDEIRLEGRKLDHPYGLTLIYHKPQGCVCSRKEGGRLIYADFPERWIDRKPPLSSVGRLDKDTSGLLIVTDDGQFNHQLTSPKRHISKTYTVQLEHPLEGNEIEMFSSGKLMLEGEDSPCLPAELSVIHATEVSLRLYEGRYHQVRRMFVAVGNHVMALQRTHIGALSLQNTGLSDGAYKIIASIELMEMIKSGM